MVSTQVAKPPKPQLVSPAGHVATQVPPAQTGVAPEHAWPHVPQFAVVVLVSVPHAKPPLPHVAKPGRQVQVPCEQYWLLLQALPHAPQLLGSFWMSAQAPKHWLSPLAQLHWPLVQAPVAQLLPQKPQLLGSVWVFTQDAPQIWLGALQVTQLPLRHCWPWVQALEQLPQWAGSDASFTHEPPHATWLPGHAFTQLPLLHEAWLPVQA